MCSEIRRFLSPGPWPPLYGLTNFTGWCEDQKDYLWERGCAQVSPGVRVAGLCCRSAPPLGMVPPPWR